jgi:hypothetical protein
MRTLVNILAAAFLAVPSAAGAQVWNADQQNLIDHVTRCWDVWVEALADETPARWLDACPIDERSHWWWTAEGVPGTIADTIRDWRTIRSVDDTWVSLRPVYVDMFGDVGIIHMYGYWRAKTPTGTVTTESKRTEVFQRRDGRWVLIGAQSAPVTPADAEPYRR